MDNQRLCSTTSFHRITRQPKSDHILQEICDSKFSITFVSMYLSNPTMISELCSHVAWAANSSFAKLSFLNLHTSTSAQLGNQTQHQYPQR